jgi:hypothetical protein
LRTIWIELSNSRSAGAASPFSSPSRKPMPPPTARPRKARPALTLIADAQLLGFGGPGLPRGQREECREHQRAQPSYDAEPSYDHECILHCPEAPPAAVSDFASCFLFYSHHAMQRSCYK